jgi:metal-dependent HD superfamily phosphatase/phosphodiesterase
MRIDCLGIEESSLSGNILNIPCGKNERLRALVQKMGEDVRLQTLWRCANVMAIDRMGYTDHGPVHVKIVSNSALRILRLLIENGIVPGVVKNYKMTNEDAEVIVVLASVFHDLGMTVLRENHGFYSIILCQDFLKRYLGTVYDEEKATIVSSEVLHALSTVHDEDKTPLTIEAGVVRIADALDMEKGRARIPFQAGKIDIHSVSALSIEEVQIEKGTDKPIIIKVQMTSSAGIFQIDQLLRQRISNSGLEKYVHVVAMIKGTEGERLIKKYEI